jgi:hypothetical protein
VIMNPATRRYGAPYLQSICRSGGSGCSFPHRSHIKIGIGAAVTRRPLPHHRAYGSVHGGSSWLR